MWVDRIGSVDQTTGGDEVARKVDPGQLVPGGRARFSPPLRYVRAMSQLFQLLGRERHA